MSGLKPDDLEIAMRICISTVFVVAGFAVLFLGLGEQSNAKLAAGWLGAVLGFWLR